jgi:hypothetical protein
MMIRVQRLLFILNLLIAAPLADAASTFYIDPQLGSMSGDGSKERPWRTLSEVASHGLIANPRWKKPYGIYRGEISPSEGGVIKAGDTLILATGDHGALRVFGGVFDKPLVIKAGQNQYPRLKEISLTSSKNWRFDGLIVIGDSESNRNTPLVKFASHGFAGPASDIHFNNSHLTSNFSYTGWDNDSWQRLSRNGIYSSAERVEIKSNLIEGVKTGITALGNHTLVHNNVIKNFSQDGIRSTGDDNQFTHNTVYNSIDVDQNHDDLFQAWSIGVDRKAGTGTIKRNILKNNVFFSDEDTLHAPKSTSQGIGCFDGVYEEWHVEGNIVVVNHWHGLTMYHATDSTITRNLILDPWEENSWQARLTITLPDEREKHDKKSTSPTNAVMSNLAHKINIQRRSKTTEKNFVIKNPYEIFSRISLNEILLRPSIGATHPIAKLIESLSGAGSDLESSHRIQLRNHHIRSTLGECSPTKRGETFLHD